MPIVTVQESAGRSREQRRGVIEGVTRAFTEHYDIPPEAVTVFFQTYSDSDWGKAGSLRSERELQSESD